MADSSYHRGMPRGRLVRSTTNRTLGGVAAGIADHFDVDVTLVRVLWILAAVIGGTGFLVYIVLWIALPEGDTVGPRSSAVAIAEERYARGEITAEEMRKIKEDLSA